MTFGDILSFIWSLMNIDVYSVIGVSISFGDIFVFIIGGTLVIWLLVIIFGGDNK